MNKNLKINKGRIFFILMDSAAPLEYKVIAPVSLQVPEPGIIFTNILCTPAKRGDYRVFGFQGYTGFVLSNQRYFEDPLVVGKHYRFIVTNARQPPGGHGIFETAVFRELQKHESSKRNILSREDLVYLSRVVARELPVPRFENDHNQQGREVLIADLYWLEQVGVKGVSRT